MKKNELGREVQGRVAEAELELIMFIEEDGETNCFRKVSSLFLKRTLLVEQLDSLCCKQLLAMFQH